MKQAANIKSYQVPLTLPGVMADTSPDDYAVFQTMQLVKFDGTTWQHYGQPMSVK